MHRLGWAAAACGLLLSGALPAVAADGDDAAFAPIHQFADGMNAGDMAKEIGRAHV